MNTKFSQNDNRRRPDDKRPKGNNRVPNDVVRKRDDGLVNAQIRRGEAQRAVRRNTENVQLRASQHVIEAVPVNKSTFNGYQGTQYTLNSARRANRLPLAAEPTLKIIPLGGVGEMGIGKNMMALEYGNDIIVMDMGFLFPGEGYPGINYIIPDTRYLEERKHKIRAHIFTHAHLDHIGAFRHIVHKIPAPVWATKFTVGMLEKTMQDATSGYNPQFNLLNPEAHERVQLCDSFSIELVRVNHSIPDSTAVVVRTPVGVIVNMGDWR
ncbi:MAG TPA: ribonuclease J, partial [Candidatus Saccharimonadales bacterium]|nr:ribonuclease J [Candidatus Saccharimonadales bacterium]